ncbi:MAG: MFS family permease [Acidimicrobiales bacterium]|jgi:MFS family permease
MFRASLIQLNTMSNRLYKSGKSTLLSALTFNDAAFWGADIFVGVVFALYITQNLGGSAIDVGLVFGLYRGVRAFAAIPIGKYLDKIKGHVDEYYTLLVASFMVGLTYFSLFFSTELWHVYIGMIAIGIGHSLDIGSWKVLFYGNLPKGSEGEVIGVYTTVMQIIYGLVTILAGFVGEKFGFEWILMSAGILTIVGGLIMFSIKPTTKSL